jgi:hypothetical protein
MTPNIRPFFLEVTSAWKLVSSRWKTLLKLVVVPLVPFALTIPYIMELLNSIQYGELPALQGATIFNFVIAFIAGVAFFVAGIITKASILHTLSQPKDLGARVALNKGSNIFFHFLWTEIIVSVYLAFSYLPFAILIFWYENTGATWFASIFDPILASIILGLLGIIFLLPLIMAVIWLSFASLITVTGDAKAGLDSLTYSTTIIRKNFWLVTLRLIGWVIFSYILTQAVQPLPYMRWIIPFLLMLTGAAFVVVLYKDARGTESPEPVVISTPKVVRKSKPRIKTPTVI